jgi:hypothetical protein
MNCPTDGSPLSISSREGIEIDFCPQCRGVWLDRGELDKIIERVSTSMTTVPDGPSREPRYEREPQYRDDRRYDDRRDDDRRYDKRKKRRGFLDDIFDFD